jgi:cobalt/nickel transport system permease protein
MTNLTSSLQDMSLLEELAEKKTFIHRLHPLAKLWTTLVYLVVVVSFGRNEVSGLLPFVFYPVMVFVLGELPGAPILKRILWVEPFIIGIGILNPLFDHSVVLLGGMAVYRGWITFLSIFVKCGLTVTVSLLLIATTGMTKLGGALRMLGVPKLFVLQLLLTYRYISVLTEEVYRMQRAYALRAPGQKGIHWKAWGSFAGQLLLRTFDRAQRVYQAMSLRGFQGEYRIGKLQALEGRDLIYILGWSLFFILGRIYNIPLLLGALFEGVLQ